MKVESIKEIALNAEILKNYSKGKIIFNENEKCKYLGFVVKGEVMIANYSLKGNEIIFKDVKTNEFFGMSLLFSSTPYYKANVIAKTDCQCCFIGKDKLLAILKNDEVLKDYLEALSNEVLKEKESSRILSYSDIKDRLLYLLSVYGKIEFESITSLSKQLKCSREAMSRTIKDLIEDNIIIKENNIIKLK